MKKQILGLLSLAASAIAVPANNFLISNGQKTPQSDQGEPSPNVYFPLPEGFKIEPDLDVSKPSKTPGAKMIKIRQGPFTVDGNSTAPGQFLTDIKLPCKSCYLTAIQGGLEFENGTDAHIDHGARLRHFMLYSGSDRDLVCDFWNIQLPNRIYATGNEREVIRVNPNNTKYGIKIADDEWFSARFELQNHATEKMDLYVTQTYEYVPMADAIDYKKVTTAWIDVAGCGGSSFTPDTGKWDIKSSDWPSTINGTLLFATAHVHDGGLNTTLYLNYEPICVSQQLYGRRPAYIEPNGEKHISESGACTFMGQIKEEDTLHITTAYDSEQHPFEKGALEYGYDSSMAINNIYIGEL